MGRNQRSSALQWSKIVGDSLQTDLPSLVGFDDCIYIQIEAVIVDQRDHERQIFRSYIKSEFQMAFGSSC